MEPSAPVPCPSEMGGEANVLLPITSGGQDLFQLIMAGYDAPAFIKRARRVYEIHEDLLLAIRRHRDKLLIRVRETLEEVAYLAGSWASAGVHLRNPGVLEQMAVCARPRPMPEHPPVSAWRIRWALSDLLRAVEHFNVAWADYLDGLNLDEVNNQRDGYNRYYVLEKECVVRNATLAASGFRPLPKLTHEELHHQFPLLPVPQLN